MLWVRGREVKASGSEPDFHDENLGSIPSALRQTIIPFCNPSLSSWQPKETNFAEHPGVIT